MFISRSIALGIALLCCSPVSSISPEQEYINTASAMEGKYGLPDRLVVSICIQESNWQNVRGSHGEIGVCQLKPDTVRHVFGLGAHVDSRMPLIAFGSTGKAVAILQRALGVSVTSYFDAPTMRWVMQYQAAHHLKVDGVVGPNTWGSLLKSPSIEEQLWNPSTNIEYSAKYLKWLSEYLHTTDPLILSAAYNGGPANGVVKYMVSIQSRMKEDMNVR